MGRRRGVVALVGLVAPVVVGVLLAGCGTYSDPSPEEPTAQPSEPTPATSEPEPTESVEEPTATPPAESELPGEAVEGYPGEGTALAVVGVPAVEELNVRLGPGTGYDVVGRLRPTGPEVTATGRIRLLDDDDLWYEVQGPEELLGWVSAAFLAELGATRDVTDAFDPAPSSDTVNGLVEAVVDAWRDGATGPPGILVGGPVTTTTLQIRVDLIEGTDPSVRGVRLLVEADLTDGGYRVSRVGLVQLCARGVSAGTCA